MSFRCDLPISKTRLKRRTKKLHKCGWCYEPILVGSPSVVTSGHNGDCFYHDRFHPECWRAENEWWQENKWSDYWPEEKQTRGTISPASYYEDEKFKIRTIWLPDYLDNAHFECQHNNVWLPSKVSKTESTHGANSCKKYNIT